MAVIEDLLALDVRVGTIVASEALLGARLPSLQLRVDFGPELGQRDCAFPRGDLTDPSDLVGLQIVAIVNLPSERVAGLDSEALILSVDDGRGARVLLIPEHPVPDGGKRT